MMTAMVEPGSMLVTCLPELDHGISRIFLADMEGNSIPLIFSGLSVFVNFS